MSTDDLSPLFRRKPAPGARFGQGRILAWNPDTFQNVVKWNGVELRDLTVLAGAEALTFVEGDEVTLVGLDQSGRRGAQSWGIWSRAIDPGSGAAEAAVDFMRGQLAKQIALDVLTARFYSDAVPLSEGTVSNPGSSYIASDGPALTNVEVSETGRCLLLITARVACQINTTNGVAAEGWMSFRVTGATTVEPIDRDSLNLAIDGPAAQLHASTVQATRLVLVDGLNPGLHTIAARYRSVGVDPPPSTSVVFSSRILTAWAF